MKVLRSGFGGLALVLATSAAGLVPATAAPLDAPACEVLQQRLDALRTEGTAADMARGPEWARANLAPERLERIGTLLQVEEQLNFRCGLAKARITLPSTIEGGEEEIPGPGEATVEGTGRTVVLPQRSPSAPKQPAAAAASVVKTPAIKPGTARKQPAKAAAPKKSPEKAAQPAADGPPPKKRAPARKKQPQADDAYRPPPRPLASESWAPAVRQ